MSCPDHGPDVVCDREGRWTDSEGFPHRTELQEGQRAALHCVGCGRLLFKGEVAWGIAQGCKAFAWCEACNRANSGH